MTNQRGAAFKWRTRSSVCEVSREFAQLIQSNMITHLPIGPIGRISIGAGPLLKTVTTGRAGD